MMTASAPAKAILMGEHAVVYGRPAIAIPLPQLRAWATVEPGPPGSGIWMSALDVGHMARLRPAATDNALAVTVFNSLARLGQPPTLDLAMTVRSDIPPARGMGSGAAIATAIVRALAGYMGVNLPPADVSDLVYRTEVLYHGTPSGIDNTVVAYEQPVWFVRGTPPLPLAVGGAFHFLIADTGVASPTHIAVGDVRHAWQADRAGYEALFDEIGAAVTAARAAIARGDAASLGPLMTTAQRALTRLGVSSPGLNALVAAAMAAGALGAKLSGGGRGGVALALVRAEDSQRVAAALLEAGAVRVLPVRLSVEN